MKLGGFEKEDEYVVWVWMSRERELYYKSRKEREWFMTQKMIHKWIEQIKHKV